MSEQKVTVIVNGESRQIQAGATLADLLAELGFLGQRIAVELNRRIIPHGHYEETALKGRRSGRNCSCHRRGAADRGPADHSGPGIPFEVTGRNWKIQKLG
ncbi:MAG: sulfur carrier protein ThiS [Methylohalobius sp.]|nr:sulfur carrier protein ThiS [Methylohalobius sp.]